MKHALLFVFSLLLVTGCQTYYPAPTSPLYRDTYTHLAAFDRDQIAAISDDELQYAVAHYRGIKNNFVLEEAVAREMIEPQDIELIKTMQLRKGMSELALLASWGHADYIIKTVESWGVGEEHIYKDENVYVKNSYVVVKNRVVDSWQNELPPRTRRDIGFD